MSHREVAEKPKCPLESFELKPPTHVFFDDNGKVIKKLQHREVKKFDDEDDGAAEEEEYVVAKEVEHPYFSNPRVATAWYKEQAVRSSDWCGTKTKFDDNGEEIRLQVEDIGDMMKTSLSIK